MRRGILLACLVAVTPLIPAGVAAASPGASDGPWTSSQAEPTEVVVSQLPAVSPAGLRTPSKLKHMPRLVRDPTALAAAKRSPKAPKGTSIPQNAGGALLATQAATFATSFPGINNGQQASQWEPPDTQMAAGPTRLMELVNSVGLIFHKDGTPAGSLFDLGIWFGLAGNYEAGDPRVLFDASTQRWYATVMGFDPNNGGSKVVLAVSTSSNPAAAWRRYVVFSSSTLLCDQPKLGYSSDKFMIGCTVFNVNIAPPNDFIGGVLIVASKTQALAGHAVTIGVTTPNPSIGGLVPAQNMQSGTTAYIVFNAGSKAVLITVTGDPATGLSHVLLDAFDVAMASTLPPDDAPQGATAKLLDTGDDRFMSAVVQDGELWTSGHAACIPSGDSSSRSCIKLLKIGVVAHTNDQDSLSGMNGKYLTYPTLGIDPNGNVAIDYTLSSASDSASHGVIYQLAGQTTLAGGGIVHAGAGAYDPNSDTVHRWGDYGAVARDPTVPTRLWFAGEYTIAPDWGTGIGAVDFTSLNLSPTGIGFGAELVGQTSAPQAFTVTNNGDFDVQVTAAMSSGDISQFFIVDNACASVLLHPTDTCLAHFTFNPTTAGDKQARFKVSGPNYGLLYLVLSGTGVGASCASAAVNPDVASPQNVGATVTLNATSAGCPNVNALYRFYLRSPAGVWSIVQDFSTSTSFVWNTTGFKAGTYLIGVWVKDAGSTKTYDAFAFGTFTIQFPSCTSTNLTSDVASPQQPPATVTFTATAAGCPAPLYQWWVRNAAGVWSIAVPFASGDTFVWNTTGLPNGTYQVGIWAKQPGSTKSYEAFAFVTYTLTAIPVTGTTHCEAVNVSAVPPSPSDVGTPVTLTASAPPDGCALPQYKWWVRDTSAHWAVVQDYPGASAFVWTTGSRPAGTYLVGVWVRQTGSAASYEAYSFITYTLTIAPANRTCSSVGISPDVASPQAPGATITFTASAAGCTVPTYKFWLLPPGGAWTVVQAYSATTTYVWNTTGLAPGPHQVGVWARKSGSAASYEAFAFITFQLQVTYTPCSAVTMTTSPSQIVTEGSNTITFTASTTGCSSPTYVFYLRHGASGAFVLRASGSPSDTVGLSGIGPGPWTEKVLVKDAASPAAYDAFALSDFIVN